MDFFLMKNFPISNLIVAISSETKFDCIARKIEYEEIYECSYRSTTIFCFLLNLFRYECYQTVFERKKKIRWYYDLIICVARVKKND